MNWEIDYNVLRKTCFEMTRFCPNCKSEWHRIERMNPEKPDFPEYIFHCYNFESNKKKKSSHCNKTFLF